MEWDLWGTDFLDNPEVLINIKLLGYFKVSFLDNPVIPQFAIGFDLCVRNRSLKP